MPKPNIKLSEALDQLRLLQNSGRRIFRTREFSRPQRERLLKAGFLQPIINGWLTSSSPTVREGDSTPSYASFWEFCASYCTFRFGKNWHLSPEQSLLLQAENTVVPKQLVVYASRGSNNSLKLPFNTSLFDLKQTRMPQASDLEMRDGLNIFTIPAALVRVSDNFFVRHPVESQIALATQQDSTDILRHLLGGGHSVVAGRLAGAFRRIGREGTADDIVSTLQAAGYDIREKDPFEAHQSVGILQTFATSPIVGRLQLIWKTRRESIITAFPEAPGLSKDKADVLHHIDDAYQSDAYHSLSIEGYHVTASLVDRVAAGAWDPDNHEEDRKNRDALAARGYWQAFQALKLSIRKILSGENPGKIARTDHRGWYRELFAPCVEAGLLPASALAGYRNDAVYLKQSRYVPPRWETVRDARSALFDLLEQEPEPSVRAVLGHWLFGYIHPYPDGNGRMARFLMNAMLTSGGYPWTIIEVGNRRAYLDALDTASIETNTGPFTNFIAQRVRAAMMGYVPPAENAAL